MVIPRMWDTKRQERLMFMDPLGQSYTEEHSFSTLADDLKRANRLLANWQLISASCCLLNCRGVIEPTQCCSLWAALYGYWSVGKIVKCLLHCGRIVYHKACSFNMKSFHSASLQSQFLRHMPPLWLFI